MSDMSVLEAQEVCPEKYVLDDVIFEIKYGHIDGSAFSVKWIVISNKHSIFIINSNNDAAINNQVVATLVAMLPMFALYHKIKTPGLSLVTVDTSDGDQSEKEGLAFCGNSLNIYLIPDRDFMRTRGYSETRHAYQENFVSWHARKSVAFWRGSSTGWPLKNDSLCSIQRISLCQICLSSPYSQLYDVGLSGIVQMADEQREQILSLNIIKNFVDAKEWINYKYLIDIDGNTNSWAGFFQRLLSGSAVLKIASPNGYRQWYYDRLIPWKNFVPVEADMSDLDEKLLWLREHDEQAERIGAAGRELALSLDYEEEIKNSVGVIDAAFSHPFHPRGEAANPHGPDISFPARLETEAMSNLPQPDITTVQPYANHKLPSLVRMAMDRAIAGESKISSDVLAIDGMSGKKYRMFINNLISLLDDARYLEIGVWAGSTLCAAIFGNRVLALAVDNWSQFGGPKELFLKNLDHFKGPFASVSFREQDFREIDYAKIGKFNVYLFDGPHEESDQADGITLALPALDDNFLLVVDDWNWEEVRNGTLRAIADAHLHYDYLVEIRTTRDNTHPTIGGSASDWHNGYLIACLSKTAG